MNFLSLFSGIGGLDLGLERAGMRCVGQVEIDPFCRRVLAKHWPDVPRFEDVRELVVWMRPPRRLPVHLRGKARSVRALLENCDLICGGFPCQDISNAGKRVGIDGQRSGLWSEFRRIICTIRPRYVLVENVTALLVRGIDRVLGNLATGGYDAEWDCIPAAAVGAPHIRDRVFIVGTRNGSDAERGGLRGGGCGTSHRETRGMQGSPEERERLRIDAEPVGSDVPDAEGVSRKLRQAARERQGRSSSRSSARIFSDANRESLGRLAESRGQRGQWATEPALGRVVDGVPNRVDRLRGLGNAVVPQVAELIGRAIITAHAAAESEAA